ncbi:hypothetical protein P7K49_003185, partial [Saguinus oedipus]
MLANSFTLAAVLTQWVIYAIRNLTEDNSQNQDVIAKMEEQGLADPSLLKQMGFEVEKKGEKLILKSTRDTPKPEVWGLHSENMLMTALWLPLIPSDGLILEHNSFPVLY